MNLQTYFDQQSNHINHALLGFLPKKPSILHEAMHYAVMSGGKRVRPILALAACEAVGGDVKQVMAAACAIELIHSYSLAHDDLPCMDDDALRRGQPSCHAKFGEDTALLAGDALLTLAFKITALSSSSIDAKRQLEANRLIADAAAAMVEGQVMDIQWQDKEKDVPTIEFINTHKSGALIAVSTRVGAYLGGASPKKVEALYLYGKFIGLLFQVVDDIMDKDGYVKVVGLTEARREAERLAREAKRQLLPFRQQGQVLSEIADFLLIRKN